MLRHRFLGRWAELVCRYPWWTLAITGMLTLASVVVSTLYLGFQSDRNELVAHSLEWNKRFLDWQRRFPGTRDLVAVIDTGAGAITPERRDKARQLADQLGAALIASGHVDTNGGGVVWRFDSRAASPRSIRLLPMPAFRDQMIMLASAGAVVQSAGPAQLLDRIEAEFEQGGESAAETQTLRKLTELRTVVHAFGRVLAAPPDRVPHFDEIVDSGVAPRDPWTYLTSANERFYFIRITPRHDEAQLNALAPAIAGIRKVIATANDDHSGLSVGLTGIEVIEADETDTALADTAMASIISFVLILILLVLAYRSIKTPTLAMIALTVGVAWAFGFASVAIGHLQVLSVVFAVMLLGISDAYGVHVVANYELIRRDYPDNKEGFIAAMRKSFEVMGPGIITGSLATAAAFLTTVFTDFRGAAEMGLISGVGIVLCMAAMFSVYPALIRVTKWRHRHVPAPGARWVTFYSDRWIGPFSRHPRLTLIAGAALSLVSLVAITQMRFDYDLMKLQARGAPSVEWARLIVDEGGQSIYSGVSICRDLDQARVRARQFRALPTVNAVGGVGLLFPEDEPAKLELIRATRAAVGLTTGSATGPTTTAPAHPSAGDVFLRLTTLRLKLAAVMFREMPPAIRAELRQLSTDIDGVTAAARTWNTEERGHRLAQLQRAYDQWRGTILTALDDAPLQIDDLPFEIMRPYCANKLGDHRVALEIFPRLADAKTTGIDSALHPAFLPVFMQEVRLVDPAVTGVIAQVHESGSLILRAYVVSGFFGLLIIFGMLWFDFRSITFALMSLVPVAMGFAVTFGIMWLVGMSVNPANIIVLPLMFGIGVDSGVHILHSYRQNPTTRPLGLTQGTGTAITITALTTIVGFAALIPARHRGVASLGFVLTLGLTCTLLACMTVMPAWLELIRPPPPPAD